MRTALYPGTFDPVTNGHISLIRRGCLIFDRIIVAVADRTPKPPLFTQAERVELMRTALAGVPNVEVVPFTGLTIGYAAERGCDAVLRGMRAVSDFESEFQLALMNRRLNKKVETVFLITDYRWLFISSTIVKGAASHGGNIHGLVPDNVEARLIEIFKSGRGVAGTPCLAPQPRGFAAEGVSGPGMIRTSLPATLPGSGPATLAAVQAYSSAAGQTQSPGQDDGILAAGGCSEEFDTPEGLSPRLAIYPGTFDPITNGHLSILRRALKVFDRIIVAVAENAGKHPLFSLEERVHFAEEALKEVRDRVTVRPYNTLTVEFAREYGACAILRGLRATGDFEYEFQLALMNRRLRRSIQTVFFMTDYRWLYVSSSIIKAAVSHGGSIDGLVPDLVRDTMVDLYHRGRLHHSTPCLGAPLKGYAREEETADAPEQSAGAQGAQDAEGGQDAPDACLVHTPDSEAELQ